MRTTIKDRPWFCVYEHWRPDKGTVFYVGKGSIKRAFNIKNGRRNLHHENIVRKLRNIGLKVEVRLIHQGLTEEEAFALEKRRILFWKAFEVPLVNRMLHGGGSWSGFTRSPAQRALIGRLKKGNKYRLGAVLSPETRNKISIAHVGKVVSLEHRIALSKACSGEKNGFFGKKHSAEVRISVADRNRKRIWTDEMREKLSQTLAANGHPMRGKKHSPETKRKMKKAASNPASREAKRQAQLRRWAKFREDARANSVT